MSCLMPKAPLYKVSIGTIQLIIEEIKRFMPFPKDNYPKVNAVA